MSDTRTVGEQVVDAWDARWYSRELGGWSGQGIVADLASRIDAAIAEAVEQEREECAKVAEQCGMYRDEDTGGVDVGMVSTELSELIAAVIRERGRKP